MVRRTARSRALPIALVAVGSLLLAVNLGVLSWGGVLGLLGLWPLALIALGLDVLTEGRRRAWIAGGTAVVALIALASGGGGGRFGPPIAAERHEIRVPLEGAERALVRLEPAVADFRVRAAAGADGLLAAGSIHTARGEGLERSRRLEEGRLELSLASTRRDASASFGGAKRSWDLALSPDARLDLEIDGGVGGGVLDLRGLDLADLDLDLGVGSAEVVLPGAGGWSGEIRAGVGVVTVRVPEGAQVRVTVDRGLGGVRIDDAFASLGSETWSTPGWDAAAAHERATLRVSGGVGGIELLPAR